jgi:hypothetical protein
MRRGRPIPRGARVVGGSKNATIETPSRSASRMSSSRVKCRPASARWTVRASTWRRSASFSCVMPRWARTSAMRRPTSCITRAAFTRRSKRGSGCARPRHSVSPFCARLCLVRKLTGCVALALLVLWAGLPACSSSSAYDRCTSDPAANPCVLDKAACCGCYDNPPCSGAGSGSGGDDGGPFDATMGDATMGGEGGGDARSSDADYSADAPSSDSGSVCTGSCINVPSGWTLVEATFGSAASCGAAYHGTRTLAYDGLSAAAAACSCSCGSPTGASCQVNVYPSSGCASNNTPFELQAGTCLSPPSFEYVHHTDGPTPVGGMCAPQPQTSVPQVAWADTVTLCQPSEGQSSCPGAACAPPVDSGFVLCIETVGTATCPSGWPNPHAEYTSVDDTRGCSSCSCAAPAGIACSGTLEIFVANGCAGSFGGYSLPAGCESVGTCGTPCTGSLLYAATVGGGSCAASSVSATGGATPAGSVTVCCQ